MHVHKTHMLSETQILPPSHTYTQINTRMQHACTHNYICTHFSLTHQPQTHIRTHNAGEYGWIKTSSEMSQFLAGGVEGGCTGEHDMYVK
jgi:hypothetical protein